jgi:hypothetical protein
MWETLVRIWLYNVWCGCRKSCKDGRCITGSGAEGATSGRDSRKSPASPPAGRDYLLCVHIIPSHAGLGRGGASYPGVAPAAPLPVMHLPSPCGDFAAATHPPSPFPNALVITKRAKRTRGDTSFSILNSIACKPIRQRTFFFN